MSTYTSAMEKSINLVMENLARKNMFCSHSPSLHLFYPGLEALTGILTLQQNQFLGSVLLPSSFFAALGKTDGYQCLCGKAFALDSPLPQTL